jgi:hypothetical protein
MYLLFIKDNTVIIKILLKTINIIHFKKHCHVTNISQISIVSWT